MKRERSKYRPEHEVQPRCEVCAARSFDDCSGPPTHDCPRRVAALPTWGEYFGAAEGLSVLLRRALDERGTVTRGEIRKALVRYERVREASKA